MVNWQHYTQDSSITRGKPPSFSIYVLFDKTLISRPLLNEQCYAPPPSAACLPINLSLTMGPRFDGDLVQPGVSFLLLACRLLWTLNLRYLLCTSGCVAPSGMSHCNRSSWGYISCACDWLRVFCFCFCLLFAFSSVVGSMGLLLLSCGPWARGLRCC